MWFSLQFLVRMLLIAYSSLQKDAGKCLLECDRWDLLHISRFPNFLSNLGCCMLIKQRSRFVKPGKTTRIQTEGNKVDRVWFFFMFVFSGYPLRRYRSQKREEHNPCPTKTQDQYIYIYFNIIYHPWNHRFLVYLFTLVTHMDGYSWEAMNPNGDHFVQTFPWTNALVSCILEKQNGMARNGLWYVNPSWLNWTLVLLLSIPGFRPFYNLL